MYINLSSTTKLNRAAVINTAIANGLLQVYSGSPPSSPDYPPTGTLLATLNLPTPAATAVYSVQQATVNYAGTSGTDGQALLTGTTGTGVFCQVNVQILMGIIVSILSIALAGAYTVIPIDITNEPVTGSSLQGATLALVMTGQLIFNPIPQSTILVTGIAGYARITDPTGLIGIMDLDIDIAQPFGTPNPSVVVNTTSLVAGGPISVLTDVLVEA